MLREGEREHVLEEHDVGGQPARQARPEWAIAEEERPRERGPRDAEHLDDGGGQRPPEDGGGEAGALRPAEQRPHVESDHGIDRAHERRRADQEHAGERDPRPRQRPQRARSGAAGTGHRRLRLGVQIGALLERDLRRAERPQAAGERGDVAEPGSEREADRIVAP